MDIELQRKLTGYLAGFATQNRLDRIEQVLARRTRYITAVLENIYQPHNASAVLRTMECFGIQDVHIIENEYRYTVNPEIALGAFKWLTLIRYGGALDNTSDNSSDAINHLRNRGYRIVATTPHPKALNIENFDVEKAPAAFFFGTELEGLSETVLKQADEFVRIPICGFTESFNISVTAALVVHQLAVKTRRSENICWQLSDKEKEVLRLEWLRQSVKHPDFLIRRFLEESGMT